MHVYRGSGLIVRAEIAVCDCTYLHIFLYAIMIMMSMYYFSIDVTSLLGMSTYFLTVTAPDFAMDSDTWIHKAYFVKKYLES